MKNTTTEHIIAYLEGKLSADDLIEFENQLDISDSFRKEVDDIAFIWKTSQELKLYDKADTEGNWNKISKKITKDKYKAKLWSFSRSVAAILLLPMLMFSAYLYVKLDNKDNQSVAQLHITSAYGTITKATLPDGTEVWLNSGSTLNYPQFFSNGKRSVSLTGEAYFKVSSDKSNRFDVNVSNKLVVSAYGTEFNIDSYEENNKIDVTLIKGNIDVLDINKSNFQNLIPGQNVSYDKMNKLMAMTDVNLSVKTGWKDGKMIFRRASMSEVVQRLSRHFNVDISLEGKELYNYEYSATFTTETLNEILQLLEKTAPIKYVTIEPEPLDDHSFTRKSIKITLKTIKKP